ncbi:MAG: hypothetical protein ABI779_00420 [Acidobacteriota bacterium]
MNHPAPSIRRPFLQPETHYSLSNTATLLGLERSEVLGWIVSGELEALDIADELRIPWSELVTFALELMGQEAIEEALGTDMERAMPELVRLAELRVHIPRYEISALEQIAARDGSSVDSVVVSELSTLPRERRMARRSHSARRCGGRNG